MSSPLYEGETEKAFRRFSEAVTKLRVEIKRNLLFGTGKYHFAIPFFSYTRVNSIVVAKLFEFKVYMRIGCVIRILGIKICLR